MPINKKAPTYAAITDAGLSRENNEDAYGVLAEAPGGRAIFVVADGVGGAVAGEEASRLAVDVVLSAFREGAAGAGPADILRRAFSDANAAVYNAGAGDTGAGRRGSTCTALVLGAGRYVVGHVGDSRAYLLRDGTLNQITQDHSLVAEAVASGLMTAEEAARSDQRYIITRAFGTQAGVQTDIYEGAVAAGDRFLLCTDGLTNELSDDEITALAARAGDAEAIVGRLIAAANARGGRDNITVILVVLTVSKTRRRRRRGS